jgi:hypothetical protein
VHLQQLANVQCSLKQESGLGGSSAKQGCTYQSRSVRQRSWARFGSFVSGSIPRPSLTNRLDLQAKVNLEWSFLRSKLRGIACSMSLSNTYRSKPYLSIRMLPRCSRYYRHDSCCFSEHVLLLAIVSDCRPQEMNALQQCDHPFIIHCFGGFDVSPTSLHAFALLWFHSNPLNRRRIVWRWSSSSPTEGSCTTGCSKCTKCQKTKRSFISASWRLRSTICTTNSVLSTGTYFTSPRALSQYEAMRLGAPSTQRPQTREHPTRQGGPREAVRFRVCGENRPHAGRRAGPAAGRLRHGDVHGPGAGGQVAEADTRLPGGLVGAGLRAV